MNETNKGEGLPWDDGYEDFPISPVPVIEPFDLFDDPDMFDDELDLWDEDEEDLEEDDL